MGTIRSPLLISTFVVALGATCLSAEAATVGIYDTGVDANGHVLAPGIADPHWTLVSVPTGTPFTAPGNAIIETPHPAYLANDPLGSLGSSWIGPQRIADANLPAGAYVYQTQFDLTGLLATSARLDGRIASDNSLDDVILNGVSLGITGGGFTSFLTSFSITSGFVDGINTLQFRIANHDALGGPTGFRAEISGTALAVPLPTSAAMGIGLAGVAACVIGLGWRRRGVGW